MADINKVTQIFNKRLEPARVDQRSDKNMALWHVYFTQRGSNPFSPEATDEAVAGEMIECVQKQVDEFDWETSPGPRHFLRLKDKPVLRQFNPKTDKTEFDHVPGPPEPPTRGEILNDARIDDIKNRIRHEIESYQCIKYGRIDQAKTEEYRKGLAGIHPNPPDDVGEKGVEGWLEAYRLVCEAIRNLP